MPLRVEGTADRGKEIGLDECFVVDMGMRDFILGGDCGQEVRA